VPFAPPPQRDTQRNQTETNEENARQRQVEKKAEIWMARRLGELDRQQEEPAHASRRREHNARQADPVVRQINKR
jgi:hypothetical protein